LRLPVSESFSLWYRRNVRTAEAVEYRRHVGRIVNVAQTPLAINDVHTLRPLPVRSRR